MSTALAIAIPVAIIVIIYLLNRFGVIAIIPPATDLLKFIDQLLKSAKWAVPVEVVLEEIVKVLTMVQSSSDPTLTIDQKVQIASDTIAADLYSKGVQLSQSDTTIMNTILQAGFIYLNSINFIGPKSRSLHFRVVKKALRRAS